jgi:hypothetical protein
MARPGTGILVPEPFRFAIDLKKVSGIDLDFFFH